jgi:DNA invertase Pin-like site-specific DNA recombinase
MHIGYVRVSTSSQKTIRQEELMRSIGVDKLFMDCDSGKSACRIGIGQLMDFVREGDVVIVESISRFARNARDLLNLIGRLQEKGVHFISKKEDIDTSTPTGKFMVTVFAAVFELERDNILDRQREGIRIAKKRGRYKGRRPTEYPGFDKLLAKCRCGEMTAAEAMRRLGMSKTTWYRRIRQAKG